MFKKKILFKNTNGTFSQEASAIESIWAYMHGTTTKKTGRYRIRITKMSAEELISMGLAPENITPEFYGLQANLDQWHEGTGWLPCLDWVGDPLASIDKIEKDLGKQFRSFITGLAIEEDFSFDLPKPPPTKPAAKKPPFKMPKPDVGSETKSTIGKGDSDDIEWL